MIDGGVDGAPRSEVSHAGPSYSSEALIRIHFAGFKSTSTSEDFRTSYGTIIWIFAQVFE